MHTEIHSYCQILYESKIQMTHLPGVNSNVAYNALHMSIHLTPSFPKLIDLLGVFPAPRHTFAQRPARWVFRQFGLCGRALITHVHAQAAYIYACNREISAQNHMCTPQRGGVSCTSIFDHAQAWASKTLGKRSRSIQSQVTIETGFRASNK